MKQNQKIAKITQMGQTTQLLMVIKQIIILKITKKKRILLKMKPKDKIKLRKI